MAALRRFTSIRFLALAILAMCLAGMTGCASMDQYKGLQTAHEQSLQQLAQAENDVKRLKAQVDDLTAKLAELNGLLGNVDAIKRDRDLLAAQLAELQKKYDALLAANSGAPVLPEPVNKALEELAAKHPDLLEFDPRLGMVRFKSDLTFDLGSTVVKPEAKRVLAMFAGILNMPEIANQEIQVVGHTDDVPIRQTSTMQINPNNWILSTNRAWAVTDVLHANGVADNRVSASGWGDQRPIAPNSPGHRGNAQNRRVDIYIRPTTVPEGITVSTPGASRPAPVPRRISPPMHPMHAPATMPAAPAAPEVPADMHPGG
jgi:chemotaxis protein MotB